MTESNTAEKRGVLADRMNARFKEAARARAKRLAYVAELFPTLDGQNPVSDTYVGVVKGRATFWHISSDRASKTYSFSKEEFLALIETAKQNAGKITDFVPMTAQKRERLQSITETLNKFDNIAQQFETSTAPVRALRQA